MLPSSELSTSVRRALILSLYYCSSALMYPCTDRPTSMPTSDLCNCLTVMPDLSALAAPAARAQQSARALSDDQNRVKFSPAPAQLYTWPAGSPGSRRPRRPLDCHWLFIADFLHQCLYSFSPPQNCNTVMANVRISATIMRIAENKMGQQLGVTTFMHAGCVQLGTSPWMTARP